MIIRLESPPFMSPQATEDVKSLYSYLYRCTELLNIALDNIREREIKEAAQDSDKYDDTEIRQLIYNAQQETSRALGLLDGRVDELVPRIAAVETALHDLESRVEALEGGQE